MVQKLSRFFTLSLILVGCSAPTEGSSANASPSPGAEPSGEAGVEGQEGGNLSPGDDESNDLNLGQIAMGGQPAVSDECAAFREEATAELRPQDIILAVDNSGSMDGEAQAVQDRINQDLAAILEASNIDYRVILLSRYGSVGEEVGSVETGICIGAPLGGHDCSDPNSDPSGGGTGQPLTNTERFYHYSEDVDSTDALCQILDKFGSAEHADEHPGISAEGWQAYARPEAFKNFVVVTDDHVECDESDWAFSDGDTVTGGDLVAAQFDQALLALSPEHFGTATERNYNFYSIIGMAENTPSTTPWAATDPISTSLCSANNNSVETPGTGYQGLSILTGALRYPICENGNFDAIFRAIAEGIIEGATLSCEWEIPPPPAGEVFDRDKVNVQFTGSDQIPVDFLRVDSVNDCGSEGGWYYDDLTQPTRIFACPTTCTSLEGDSNGSVDVLFGCETRVR